MPAGGAAADKAAGASDRQLGEGGRHLPPARAASLGSPGRQILKKRGKTKAPVILGII